MATTRIIPMHLNTGKTIARCLADRIDYAQNSAKTDSGQLISAYACDPHTADQEFLLSKQEYHRLTGREETNDVIAYQVRQSFKPGEVTPEEANQIGYDFASRFLKGKHAFLVCTHIDRRHIHNHIIWNSTTLDCKRKFRDFRRSGKAVAQLSDLICAEHNLSVIENSQGRGISYDKWLGDKAVPSHREQLRRAIDAALEKKPHDFDVFLQLLETEGFTTKPGKQLSFLHDGFKRPVRLSSLGETYSEEILRAVIRGQRKHTPKKHHNARNDARPRTIIDIQAKLADGKGEAYRRWATVENLKRLAKTKLYMDEQGLDYEALLQRQQELAERERQMTDRITAIQGRLSEIASLKKHVIDYARTRKIFEEYKKSGYAKRFLKEHEADIAVHREAKHVFDDLGLHTLPTVKSLQEEAAALTSERKVVYAQRKQIRDELRKLAVHRANYDSLKALEAETQRKDENIERE